MASVEANGVTLEYEIEGSGPPLLFIMGLGGQLASWPQGFIDLFVEAGFQAIRFDNRDSGLSSKTPGPPVAQKHLTRAFLTRRRLSEAPYNLSDMADDAAALLDALDIEAADVVGISMGGMIAQELTICHPGKVLSLCSIMSNTGDRKNGGVALGLLAKIARAKPSTRETAVEGAVEALRDFSGPHFDVDEYRQMAEMLIARSYNPAGIAHQTAAIVASRDRTQLLGKVAVPSLVIHGLVDPLVKPSGGVATAKAIPNSRLLAFADMGHDLPRPRWAEMCRAILANVEQAGATQTKTASS